MIKSRNMKQILLATIIVASIAACKKDPGEGGRATIKGKVYVRNYNSTYTLLNDQYFAQGENVYIMYGDIPGIGNSVRTAYDGSFQFPYLRKGKYKVYALSKDSTSAATSKTIEVLKEIEIKDKKEVVDVGTIVILK